jgi:hypothetical protein
MSAKRSAEGNAPISPVQRSSTPERKPRSAFKESPNKEDYVWGDIVYAVEIKDKALKETSG